MIRTNRHVWPKYINKGKQFRDGINVRYYSGSTTSNFTRLFERKNVRHRYLSVLLTVALLLNRVFIPGPIFCCNGKVLKTNIAGHRQVG